MKKIGAAYAQHVHEDIEPKLWLDMFLKHRPAVLERGEEKFYGGLEPFTELGMEGSIACLFAAYDKEGRDELMSLENGDKLTVYKKVTGGEPLIRQTIFLKQGRVDLYNMPESGRASISQAPNIKDQHAFNEAFRKHKPACLQRIG